MITQQSLVVVVAFSLFSMATRAQDAQDADIKQVVLHETDSYFKKDAPALEDTWLQDPTASVTFVSAYGYKNVNGWDSIHAKLLRLFKQNPNPESMQMTTDSFTVRKEGKLAIVDYKQTLTFPENQPPFDKSNSREHRVMVKKNGKWKIASEISTDVTGYMDPSGELTLNSAGYAFLFDGKTDQAIQILELNTKLFPNSYNVFDSLGEAYAKAGQKDLAIQNYEKSLQLNPKNESGIKALKTLRQ